MFPLIVKPLLRRAVSCAFPSVIALSFGVANPAIAQSANEFASSTQPVLFAADSDSSSALPAPSPAIGGGQSERAYGSRNRGMFNHMTFEAGGGFNAPSKDSSKFISWGGNFTVGAGYRINPYFSVLTEYQFIDNKLPGAIISETGAQGGHAHIWSFTLDPVIDLFPRSRNDVYITGGGGFYRKVTSFTDPVTVEYCDFYYCGITTVNQVVGHFSSNQGGWNVGVGLTHKLGNDRTKLFAEARYLDVDTPAVTSQPNGLGTTTVGAETKLVPVTFGVRF